MIYHADCRSIPLPDGCVQCVVTSPPYYGLRDYGTATWEGGDAECDHVEMRVGMSDKNTLGPTRHLPETNAANTGRVRGYRDLCGKCGAKRIDAQIGLEATPEAYLDTMVAVFREIRRVLRDNGTVFLNIGDSYAGGGGFSPSSPSNQAGGSGLAATRPSARLGKKVGGVPVCGYKPKDLMGMPWRLAFALQADGWYLRSDIIWAKPNPMPESVTDRPTRSHEYIFLLTKLSSYYYDADAVREPAEYGRREWSNTKGNMAGVGLNGARGHATVSGSHPEAGRNRRDVWTIPSQATPEAHFATFPEKLVEPCVLAGTSAKGCCSECGAPYVRETETISARNESWHDHKNDLQRGQRGKPMPADYRRETTGWRAACTHDAAIQPCLVFDPFGGSGTVGVVCERLGRRWAMTELSEAYIKIAEKRTCQQGLFSHAIAD